MPNEMDGCPSKNTSEKKTPYCRPNRTEKENRIDWWVVPPIVSDPPVFSEANLERQKNKDRTSDK